MLRIVLLAFGGLMVIVGVACLAAGAKGAWPVFLVWGLLLVVGVLFERNRYKRPLAAPPGPDWTATQEKFIDPASGAAVVVYFKPSTGQRVYVLDKTSPP